MWSHTLLPSGNAFLPFKSHQKRGFSMIPQMIPIIPAKELKNSNFVNNVVNSIDTLAKKSNCSQIITSIKEKCPEIISCGDPQQTGSPSIKKMRKEKSCRLKEPRKNSKQNQTKQQLQEMLALDFDGVKSEVNCSPKRRTFTLKDFIVSQPPGKSTKIEIPFVNKAEMVLTITKSPPCSQRQLSESESDDNFIVENEDSQKPRCWRQRQVSFCESEDSFIIFDREDAVSESSCDIDEESSSEDDSSGDESSYSIVEPKKVRFASDDKLCDVHPMIKWSYAYQAARKGPWEQHARDRSRFNDRVLRVEQQIKHVFNPKHRENIYKERFKELL
ncbi:uncharacterized protein LOC132706615 [Cylas formicarius]|uniref:uncharacterized protein LOC132706615 n=1 Tax=Cylas formicarius TaxID=197179 RepID=UPI002958CB08|nr:uncharacterized protein LOC132706615 [Cylas formicarius]